MWTSSSWRHSGRFVRRLAVAGALASLLTGTARAQRVTPHLPPVGAQVRVLLRDSTHAHGKLMATSADAITLRRLVGVTDPEVIDRPIPSDSILVVWQRTGTRWFTGALAGGVVGLIGSFVLVQAFVQVEGQCDPECGTSVSVLYVVGAATGALLGALVGHQLARWKIVPGG